MVELAASPDGLATRQQLSEAQGIPGKFLEAILTDLRRAGLLSAQRGSRGGFRLALPPEQIPLATVIRAVEGPLAAVRGESPEETAYPGAAEPLTKVWVALRASLRQVLETTTVADVAAGVLPSSVVELLAEPDAWVRR